MPAVVDAPKCEGCGDCELVCGTDAIAVADGKAVVSEDDCIECGDCVDECPHEAITMS